MLRSIYNIRRNENEKRDIVLNKSGGFCWYCGCDLNNTKWHMDNFEPVIRDLKTGKPKKPELDCIENLVPYCASCNILKGSVNIESFRKYVEGTLNSLENHTNIYKIAKRYGMVKEIKREIKFWFEENI